ncbi:MAG: hypothetical protein KDB14_17015 [Planctomycetales bacterium]|nr:hypothetical protein [Planctomycetales bacterium]
MYEEDLYERHSASRLAVSVVQHDQELPLTWQNKQCDSSTPPVDRFQPTWRLIVPGVARSTGYAVGGIWGTASTACMLLTLMGGNLALLPQRLWEVAVAGVVLAACGVATMIPVLLAAIVRSRLEFPRKVAVYEDKIVVTTPRQERIFSLADCQWEESNLRRDSGFGQFLDHSAALVLRLPSPASREDIAICDDESTRKGWIDFLERRSVETISHHYMGPLGGTLFLGGVFLFSFFVAAIIYVVALHVTGNSDWAAATGGVSVLVLSTLIASYGTLGLMKRKRLPLTLIAGYRDCIFPMAASFEMFAFTFSYHLDMEPTPFVVLAILFATIGASVGLDVARRHRRLQVSLDASSDLDAAGR